MTRWTASGKKYFILRTFFQVRRREIFFTGFSGLKAGMVGMRGRIGGSGRRLHVKHSTLKDFTFFTFLKVLLSKKVLFSFQKSTFFSKKYL